ncbi:hypothetical protein FACS1894105_09060 [Clostridia bacterium]|nr:hypothetical protein FACS1894105_09060 [Clostridia bacterium]
MSTMERAITMVQSLGEAELSELIDFIQEEILTNNAKWEAVKTDDPTEDEIAILKAQLTVNS